MSDNDTTATRGPSSGTADDCDLCLEGRHPEPLCPNEKTRC